MHIICEYDAGKKSIVRNVRGEPIKKNQERERKRERERRQSFEIGNFVFLFESNQKESKRENKRENTSKLGSIYIKKKIIIKKNR